MLLKIAGTTYLITFFNSPIRQNASPAHFAGYCVTVKIRQKADNDFICLLPDLIYQSPVCRAKIP